VITCARLPPAADPARAFPASDWPDPWNYWRREALGYETGLAATACAGAEKGRAGPARGESPR
jgi:hypothetical protein